MNLETTLTKEEEAFAKKIGTERNQRKRAAGRADGLISGNSLQRDIEGAEGEVAGAKMLGIVYDGDPMPDEVWEKWRKTGTDVGPYEIRLTNRAIGDLFIHDRDKDNVPYISIIKKYPLYTMTGWMFAREAKQQKYWELSKTKKLIRPCYCVPRTDLHNMDTLPKLL